MKVGVYTIHTDHNYGAMLQAFATLRICEKLGFDATLVKVFTKRRERENAMLTLEANPRSLAKFVYARISPDLRARRRKFDTFHSAMKQTRRYFSWDEYGASVPQFDVHLVGSDQVWNSQNGLKRHFLLDFLRRDERKIAFASSFGTSSVKGEYHEEIKKLLSSFEAISVREDDGVNIVADIAGLPAKQVCDPTLCLSKEEWRTVASARRTKSDYIFFYGFQKSDSVRRIIEETRKRLRLPVVALAVGHAFPFKADEVVLDGGPSDYLRLMLDAKFIIANSFHGVAFAVNFGKSFFSVPHPTRNSRMASILRRFGLEDREIDDPDRISSMTDKELSIDYDVIGPLLEEFSTESVQWLKEAVAAEQGEGH